MDFRTLIRTPAELGAAFRAERKAARLTQQEVARRGGLRRETIVKLEAGGNVDTLTLLKAVGALGQALRIVRPERLDCEELKALFDALDEEDNG